MNDAHFSPLGGNARALYSYVYFTKKVDYPPLQSSHDYQTNNMIRTYPDMMGK
jgi:hypothetical protein